MTNNAVAKFTWNEEDIIWPDTDTRDAYNPDQPRKPKGDPDGGKWTPTGGSIGALDKHTEMRDYTQAELDWEYEREYKVYTQPNFPHAFSSRADFQKQYDDAPLVHLSLGELQNLGNSMAASGLNKGESWVHSTFSHRRDTTRILNDLRNGKTAPPIVLEHGNGKLWLMAGQTRLAAGLALGKSVPVKKIKVRTTTKDATQPRSLYVRRNVVNHEDLTAWAKAQGFEATRGDTMHVTIMFSRSKVDWIEMGSEGYGSSEDGKLTIPPGGPRVIEEFGQDPKVAVLAFSNTQLQWRHKEMLDKGCSFDFPDYTPHITIASSEGIDITKITPYQEKIILGPEIFEEVNEDWKQNIEEN